MEGGFDFSSEEDESLDESQGPAARLKMLLQKERQKEDEENQDFEEMERKAEIEAKENSRGKTS